MPDYLTLSDGGAAVVVAIAGVDVSPIPSGEKVRTYDNALRSTENATQAKRDRKYTTGPLPSAEYAALMALVADGSQVLTAAGWGISRAGGTLSVLPTVDSESHVPDGDDDFTYVVTFTLHEL